MDGTGTLLSDFVSAFAEGTPVRVIDYPTSTFMNYDQLAGYVRERLPTDDFVLIGESFSGPLALTIAAEQPQGLKGVVLCASFARLDVRAKPMVSWAAAAISPGLVPQFALSYLLLGKWATPQNVKAFRLAIGMVSPEVFSGRARAALAVDLVARGVRVSCPTLLLEARHDRLIPRTAAKTIGQICSKLRIETIDGPHFLLEVASRTCAAVVQRFSKELLG